MKKVKVAKATEQTLNENRDTLRESIKRLVREFLDKKKTLN
jgi:hypothetical protein